jgi:hypothetical protein
VQLGRWLKEAQVEDILKGPQQILGEGHLEGGWFSFFILITGSQLVMDSFTRNALTAQINDEKKNGSEVDLLHLEDRLVRLEFFETLDGVIGAFFNTNIWRGKNFTLDDLLKVSSKRYFRYEHLSIPYRATVTRIEDCDATWQCLKLANNGFQYTAKSGERISRHKYNGWIVLGVQEFLQHFPTLQRKVKGAYDEAQVFYTFEERRVDVKLYPSDETLPHLMITFEEGYPDWSDTAARQKL